MTCGSTSWTCPWRRCWRDRAGAGRAACRRAFRCTPLTACMCPTPSRSAAYRPGRQPARANRATTGRAASSTSCEPRATLRTRRRGLAVDHGREMRSGGRRPDDGQGSWSRLIQRSPGPCGPRRQGGDQTGRGTRESNIGWDVELHRLRHGHTPDNASTTHLKPCVSYVTDTQWRTLDTCRSGAPISALRPARRDPLLVGTFGRLEGDR